MSRKNYVSRLLDEYEEIIKSAIHAEKDYLRGNRESYQLLSLAELKKVDIQKKIINQVEEDDYEVIGNEKNCK